jgi:hypothetical protein
LFAAGSVWADAFTITWERADPITGGAVLADSTPGAVGSGGVTFANMPEKSYDFQPNGVMFNTVASNLTTFSAKRSPDFDTFTNQLWSLMLTIKALDPNDMTTVTDSRTLTYSGVINGKLNQDFSNLHVSLTSPAVMTAVVGNHNFTVNIDQFVDPADQNVGTKGSIGGTISVDAGNGGGLQNSPEPSSMVLSVLGLSCLAVMAWRKKRAN